jgi:phosphohistidine phosphatase
VILYVLRHGIAETDAPGGDDRLRRLTPRGREKMRAAAEGMAALGLDLDVLLTSPLVRAAETAAIVADVLPGCPTPREFLGLAPSVGAAEVVRGLRPFARQEAVAIVGHEPGLSQVASLLLAGSPGGVALVLKKGGLIAIEIVEEPAPRSGTLRWMLTPRHLRRLGR